VVGGAFQTTTAEIHGGYGLTHRFGTESRVKRCGDATAEEGYCSNARLKSGWSKGGPEVCHRFPYGVVQEDGATGDAAM
jgi:hypothetical protein